MGEKSKQDIEKIVEVLLRMFNQVEVIIFGSVANGTERDNRLVSRGRSC
jgi:predicted nucleotidyltransferase